MRRRLRSPGAPTEKPAYLQNSFGGSVGGPLNIPHIYHGGSKTFYFVNFNGKHGENPFDQFSTVPTLLERQGNFLRQTTLRGFDRGNRYRFSIPLTNAAVPKCHASANQPGGAGIAAIYSAAELAGQQLSKLPLRDFRQQRQRRSEHTCEPQLWRSARGRTPRRRPQRSAQQPADWLSLPSIERHADQSVPQRWRQHNGSQLRYSRFLHPQHRKADQHRSR
jgi:hypothetical protein